MAKGEIRIWIDKSSLARFQVWVRTCVPSHRFLIHMRDYFSNSHRRRKRRLMEKGIYPLAKNVGLYYASVHCLLPLWNQSSFQKLKRQTFSINVLHKPHVIYIKLHLRTLKLAKMGTVSEVTVFRKNSFDWHQMFSYYDSVTLKLW